MKVLMIVPVPFFNDRGCSVRVYEEATALIRRGHEIEIVTYHLGDTPPGLSVTRSAWVPWYTKIEAGPSWHRFYIDFLLLIKAIAVQARFRAEIIHGHLHEGGLIGWVVAHLFGVPLIFDYQGSLTQEVEHYDFMRRGGMLHRIFGTAESLINRLPDKIIVSSGAALPYLARRFSLAPPRVEPLVDGVGMIGPKDSATTSRLRRELGISEDALVVLYAGSLSGVENMEEMFTAMKQVLEREPRAVFMVMGYPDVEKWRTHARTLGIGDRIVFTGRISYFKWLDYVSLANVAISAKLQVEANGKLFSYMVAGKPVIAFDHPVNREILGDLGYYPRAANAESFADEILRALSLSKEELTARGNALEARARELFSWDSRAVELEKMYHDLLRQPAHAPLGFVATIRRHSLAVLLAVVVGGISAAPFLYFASTPQYRGIAMMGADAEDHYLARMQDIREGHYSLGNVFLSNKNQPYFAPGGGEIIAMVPSFLLGITTAETEMFDKFLFPFLVALLVYALGFSISRSRGTSLLIAATVTLGDNALLQHMSAWADLLRGTSSNVNFIALSRPINPEVSWLFLFGGMLLLHRIFFTRTARRWEAVLLGMLIASALYVSAFVFSFLGMVVLLVCLLKIARREWREAGAAFFIGCAGLIGSVPFFLNYEVLIRDAAYATSAMRQGLIHTRSLMAGSWLPLLLVAALFAWPRRFAPTRSFVAIGALSLLILLNQQVVTGTVIQPGHYHWYITMPIVFIVVALYVGYALERFVRLERARAVLVFLGVLLFVFGAALAQSHSYRAQLPAALRAQSYAPLLAALRSLPAERVVWSSADFSIYVPIYTTHESPADGQMTNYLVPFSYIQDRLFLTYRLRGISKAEALSYMTGVGRAETSANLYSLYWLHQSGSFEAIPQNIIEAAAAAYRQTFDQPLLSLFKNLEITTLVWDSSADPAWGVDRFPFVHDIYTSGSLSLWSVDSSR